MSDPGNRDEGAAFADKASAASESNGASSPVGIAQLVADAREFLLADHEARETVFFPWTQEPLLHDLVTLSRSEPAKVASALAAFAKIRGYGGRVRDLRATVAKLQSRSEHWIKSVVDAAGQYVDDSCTLIKHLPDLPKTAPVGLMVPPGWSIDTNGLWVHRAGDDCRVAHRPVIILSKHLDLGTNESMVRVAWRGNVTGWRDVEVERKTVMDQRGVVRLAALDVPVSSDNAQDMVKWFSDFEAANEALLRTTPTTTRMGWHTVKAHRVFVLPDMVISEGGNESVAFEARDHEARRTAGAIRTSGTMDGWLEALAHVATYPLMFVMLYASCASPLLEIVGCPNFTVDVSDDTSSGKSTSLILAASAWGSPALGAGVVRSWADTITRMEQSANVMNSLPLGLDESKRARKREHVADVLYVHNHGFGRGRSRSDGVTTQPTAEWRSVLLSTGEYPATSFTKDAGTRARVLSLRGRPLGPSSKAAREAGDTMADGVSQHYGHLGRAVVAYVVDQLRNDSGTELCAYYKVMREHYGGFYSAAVATRLSAYIAVLHVAADIVHDACGVPRPDFDPFETLLQCAARGAIDADQPLVAYTDFLGWCASRQDLFVGRRVEKEPPHEGWAGAWDGRASWDHIAIRPPVLRSHLISMGYDPDEMIERWGSRGYLESGPAGAVRRAIRIDGVSTSVFVLVRSEIEKAVADVAALGTFMPGL